MKVESLVLVFYYTVQNGGTNAVANYFTRESNAITSDVMMLA